MFLTAVSGLVSFGRRRFSSNTALQSSFLHIGLVISCRRKLVPTQASPEASSIQVTGGNKREEKKLKLVS